MPRYSTTVDISSWKTFDRNLRLAKLHDDGSLIRKGKKFLGKLQLGNRVWSALFKIDHDGHFVLKEAASFDILPYMDCILVSSFYF